MNRIILLTSCVLLLIFCSRVSDSEVSDNNTHSFTEFKSSELTKEVLKYVKYKSDTIVLLNATLYDGQGSDAMVNYSVLIVNGIIHSIGQAEELLIPKTALRIDLEGKTIIPGIVGVHNHLHIPGNPFVGELASLLYLASGVTTIQTCGAAAPGKELALAEKIRQGKFPGPDIFPSGPYITGPGGNPNMFIPKDGNELIDTVRYWLDRGVKWFKVYRSIRPDDLALLIEEAHMNNARVTGHLCSVTFEEATKLGIDGIEHGLNSTSDFRLNKTYGMCDGSREYIDEIDVKNNSVQKLLKQIIENNVFITSTLAIYESSIPNRGYADKSSLKYMAPSLRTQYYERRKEYDLQISNESKREERLKRIMAFEYEFYKLGGTLNAGVDAGRHVLPGFGDLRNYELLREAGFTISESIKIMTGNGAKILSDNKIGVIAAGGKADLVVIDESIDDSIRNIEIVFKDGYGYEPELLLNEVIGKFGAN